MKSQLTNYKDKLLDQAQNDLRTLIVTPKRLAAQEIAYHTVGNFLHGANFRGSCGSTKFQYPFMCVLHYLSAYGLMVGVVSP